jgi:cobalt-zinc-cadmium efflux system outer membrane protein
MAPRRLLALCSVLVLVSGCLYHAREQTDAVVADLAAHPFDLAPPPPESPPSAPAAALPSAATKPSAPPTLSLDVQTTAYMQARPEAAQAEEIRKRMERVQIPPEIPGSEAEFVKQMPEEEAAKRRLIARLYPELPPLPDAPTPLPGPDGHPYTLAELQQLAALNSPTLREFAADVKAAEGNLLQARVYPNPSIAYVASPSNDGSTPGVQGVMIAQTVRTTGKQKLQTAAAEMDLRNAELALKRARSDLATQVRNAYYGLLVAQEAVRVNRALARFTDEIYLLQRDLLVVQAAPHEPAALRAQTHTVRLAYKNAIQNYIAAWQQLVATVGLRQLPLTQVAGRIDAVIPYYDRDAVLAHALRNHTDVLIARNGVDRARYNLMAAQVTPISDVNFSVTVQKEFALPPFQWVPSAQVGVTLPIWDQNKGAITAAEAALVRATEEPHRVEVTMTINLAAAYANYKNNLDALESYRRFILPDQVRYYRGILLRRTVDNTAAFGDLVAAQQTLAGDVTSYLSTLGTLWTSVVSVADFLQTDDLFQLAHPQEVPELPDLEHLPDWLCPHPAPAGPPAPCAVPPAPNQGTPPQVLAEPRRLAPPGPAADLRTPSRPLVEVHVGWPGE